MRLDFSSNDLILTANDVVYRLNDKVGGDGNERLERMLFRSIQESVREVATLHDWKYYKKQIPLYFSGSTSRACTKIAATGDSNLDKLWVQSGTAWPSNADDGHVLIGRSTIPVIRHDSANRILILDCPPSLLPGDATLTWVHKTNKLPGVQKILWVREASSSLQLQYWAPDLLAGVEVNGGQLTGTPSAYTLMQGTTLGLSDIVIYPAPTNARVIFVMARIRPAQCNVFRDEFSSPTSVTTRTFSTPKANSSWVGSVIRVSQNSSSGFETSDLRSGKYSWQSMIVSVNGNVVTVANDLPASFASAQSLVSSLVDVDIHAMQNLIEAMAYEKYCQNMNVADWERSKILLRETLALARANDSKIEMNPNRIVSEFDYPVISFGPKWSGS